MRLTRLELYRYRNLENQGIAFRERVTEVVGRNGQGKTNLLEAAFLLAQAKSFRGSLPRDLVCWSSPSNQQSAPADSVCRVIGTVATGDGDSRLVVEVNNGKRRIAVNEQRIMSAAELYGRLLALVFTPEELQLVKGAPTVRRRYLDRALAMSDGSYTESLLFYQRALKQRNAALGRLRRKGNTSLVAARQEITCWDAPLIEHGRRILERRIVFCTEIAKRLDRYYSALSPKGDLAGSGERVGIEYCSRFLEHDEPLGATRWQEIMERSLETDLRTGSTTNGIHRDDIVFSSDTGYGPRPARSTASQGQARSLSLALLFATVNYLESALGESPVLLLDDVESELDQYRRAALFGLLESLASQVIITATEPSRMAQARLSRLACLHVESGRVEPRELVEDLPRKS